MLGLRFLLLLAVFTTFSNCIVTFSSPTKADSWIVGQTKTISWSQVSSIDNPKDNYLSVRLYQVFQNATTSPFFSYLIQQAVPNTITVNPAGWPVALDTSGGINSSLSNKYILALYLETQTTLLAQSEVFTIQNTTAATSPSSTIASSSTASSSILTSTTSTSISSASSSTNSSLIPSPAAASASSTALPVVVATGLSTGLKVGIATGVSAAVMAGLAAGWFLSGWRKRQSESTLPTTMMYSDKRVTYSQASTLAGVDQRFVPQLGYAGRHSGAVPMTYELPGSHKPY